MRRGLKRGAGAVLALVLAVTCLALGARPALADGTGYVTVEITYNPEWASSGFEAEARMEAANEVMNKRFSSLYDAALAYNTLFTDTGTYSSSDTTSDCCVENVGPLYYKVTHLMQLGGEAENPGGHKEQLGRENNTVSKVVFQIHGTVPLGGAVTIGSSPVEVSGHGIPENICPVTDVQVVGVGDDAQISGTGADKMWLSARVAGKREYSFGEKGVFTVKNIEFTDTTGNTQISADGTTMVSSGTPVTKNADVETVIDGCTFHNQLYSYVNDNTAARQAKTITNCTFEGGDPSVSYAFFAQGQCTEITFSGNTVSGYPRGINVQPEMKTYDGAARQPVITISDNSISCDHPTRGAIQLTTGYEVTVTGNTIVNGSGAAIWFYPGYDAASTRIEDNDIDAAFFIMNSDGTAENPPIEFNGEEGSPQLVIGDNTFSARTNIYESPVKDNEGAVVSGAPVYALSVDVPEGISVEPGLQADGTIPVVRGADQTVSLVAAEGWRITDVKVDGVSKGAISEVAFEDVREAHQVQVTAQCQHAVSVEQGKGGTVSVSPEAAFAGEKVSVTVKADDGYRLVSISAGDVELSQGTDGTYAFEMPDADVTLKVAFEAVDAQEPSGEQKPADDVQKPGADGQDKGTGLPATGDPGSLAAAALSAVGAVLAAGGALLRRR